MITHRPYQISPQDLRRLAEQMRSPDRETEDRAIMEFLGYVAAGRVTFDPPPPPHEQRLWRELLDKLTGRTIQ